MEPEATVRPGDEAAAPSVRQMLVDDVEAAMAVIDSANAAKTEAGLRPPEPPLTAAQREAFGIAHARFVERDGPGAWVAEADGLVVGVAESIRRGGFWGLSMLFVHPRFQGRGVGARLLGAALTYADGASVRMIESSPDPRAVRRYALAGLTMHPAAEAWGVPDRSAIPRSLPGRLGGVDDLGLVASVDAELGRSRAEDVAFVLGSDRFHLDVVDSGPGQGWVLSASDRLVMLGATDAETAAALVWRHLASCAGETRITGLTAAQQWGFDVAHRARLSVRVGGAVFVDGMDVPVPWIPSGWFF